jgi:hypothetical protein
MAGDDTSGSDDARAPAVVRSVGRETSRYSGPEGDVDFEAFGVMRGGEFLYRNGVMVEAIDAATLRWAGSSTGRSMTADDRARILDALRAHFRARRIPYNIRHPSGDVEDETGAIHSGFRLALPHVEHSDGWSLTDLFMSPEYPDPDTYPPFVRYRDATGEAELPRQVPTIDGERRRLLDPTGLRWIGDREGEPMNDDDRARLMARIRSAYDEWGYRYNLVD